MVNVNFGSVRKRTCDGFDTRYPAVNMHNGFRNTQLPNTRGNNFFNGFPTVPLFYLPNKMQWA